MSILTEKEILDVGKAIANKVDAYDDGLELSRAIESAVLEKLAVMALPEPETFEAWNAKQHGDPEEIGFLQALRIAYCSGQDSVNQRQACAQGAASQLRSEPVFFYRPVSNGEMYEGPYHANAKLGRMFREEKPSEWHGLYTLKEAK